MLKTCYCALVALLLTACATDTPPPNQRKLAENDIAAQRSNALIYRCLDDKVVKVVRIQKKSNTAKTAKEIQLTFNNVTEKLVPTITEKGQKYTNIHWHWQEQGENAQLSTSVGAVLAEQCIRTN